MICQTSYRSPFGVWTLCSDGKALTALLMEPSSREDALPLFAQTKNLLDQYFAGEDPDFSVLPLAPRGTAFQKEVWDLLLKIPYGETRTYGALKGNRYARAVGQALNKNPIPVIIPCHRVLAADSLGGFSLGPDLKMKLLDHEKRSL